MPGRDRFIEGFASSFNPQAIVGTIMKGLEEKKRKEEEAKQLEAQQQRQSMIQANIAKLAQGGEYQLNDSQSLNIPEAQMNLGQGGNGLGNVSPNQNPNLRNPNPLSGLLNVPQHTQSFKPYTPQDRTMIEALLSGTPEGEKEVNQYLKVQKANTPKTTKQNTVIKGNARYLEHPDYKGMAIGGPVEILPPKFKDYKFNNKDGIYAINEYNGKLEKIQEENPFYVDKPIKTIESPDKSIIREFYKDGTQKDIKTGFYVDPKGVKKIDPEKYSEVLTKSLKTEEALNSLKQQYTSGRDHKGNRLNDVQKEGLKLKINQENQSFENTMYHRLTDEARNFVDDYYDRLKSRAQSSSTSLKKLEDANQDELKNGISETLSEKFKDGELNYEDARAIRLWVNSKYGYIR